MSFSSRTKKLATTIPSFNIFQEYRAFLFSPGKAPRNCFSRLKNVALLFVRSTVEVHSLQGSFNCATAMRTSPRKYGSTTVVILHHLLLVCVYVLHLGSRWSAGMFNYVDAIVIVSTCYFMFSCFFKFSVGSRQSLKWAQVFRDIVTTAAA